jgi:hypothetical protein
MGNESERVIFSIKPINISLLNRMNKIQSYV